MSHPRFKRETTAAWLLILAGVIGLSIGGALYLHQPKPPALPRSKTVGVNPAPSSVKPSPAAVAVYQVPPANPKYISVPSIGVDQARIIQLGLLANGQIATPSNIYDVGWYNGSSKPGQPGAMFIYGHVSSWQANGVFYNLKKLKAGDTITITRGDNTTYEYVVVSTKIYPYNAVDMNQVLTPTDPRKPGLNLMTCTGQIIHGTSEFNQRLVVFTSLVSS